MANLICPHCDGLIEVTRKPRKPRKPARIITATATKTFRACNRRYRYTYVDGLRPLIEPAPFRFGTLWHDGQESWWTGREWQAPADADAFDLAKARALLAGYSARWSLDGIEVVAIEKPFCAPLIDGDGKQVRGWAIAGKVDGIIKQDGRLLLLEHKTTSVDVSPGSDYWQRLAIDTQISLYYDGAASLGYQIEGCIFDVVKKPAIRDGGEVPILDADGLKQVVDADGQRVKTLKGEWRQTGDSAKGYVVQTRAETPEEYEARCIEAIAEKPNEHFARAEIVRLDGELAAARNDLVQTVRAIEWATKHNAWPRNDAECFAWGRCPYFGLCSGTGNESEFRRVDDVHPELKA